MYTDFVRSLHGKRVTVMGLGIQGGGVGVARYFASHGAIVTVTDQKTEEQLATSIEKLRDLPIKYVCGRHELDDFTTAELVIKGPSIRWDNTYIVAAQAAKVPISMETALFMKYTTAHTIGITGTRGKSTTTMMIHQVLKKSAGERIYLAGNIPGRCTIELLDLVGPDDTVILELSSWQLSGCHHEKVSPHLAVFTNLYPDHLNYYQNIQEYFYDKSAIYLYQRVGESLWVNANMDPVYADQIRQARPDAHFVSAEMFPTALSHLTGAHNLQNAALAYVVAREAIHGTMPDSEIASCIAAYTGLAYRQEVIYSSKDLKIVNDTTSTTPIATMAALEAFKHDHLVVILGGNSKNLPTDDLISALTAHQAHIVHVILLAGTMTDEILPRLKLIPHLTTSPIYTDFNQAVSAAFETARQTTASVTILFSPGATSFAQFKNEFDRGAVFNELVKERIHG